MTEADASMRPCELVVRCYAEQGADHQWVAVCLDLALAAQADSFNEAKAKLDEQIREYVFDALAGEDVAHAEYLLSRRAPLRFWLRYWFLILLGRMRNNGNGDGRAKQVRFAEQMPLVPASC